MIRLQKFLANAGLCSRRTAETLIREGRVSVDGRQVTELGTKIDPLEQVVEVDGAAIRQQDPALYIMLHKPRGVVTTVRDTHGRPTVLGLLTALKHRVYPVGRLDQDSEGLLLLTNDGALAHRLLHPGHKVPKTYRVTVRGRPSEYDLDLLRRGVSIEGRRTMPCAVRVVARREGSTLLEVVLREGRKRQLRSMFGLVRHPVLRLVRTEMGPLRLGALPAGTWRELTGAEVKALEEATGLSGTSSRPRLHRGPGSLPHGSPSSCKGGRAD